MGSHRHRQRRPRLGHSRRDQSLAVRLADARHGALGPGHRRQSVVHQPLAPAASRRHLRHLRTGDRVVQRPAADRAGRRDPVDPANRSQMSTFRTMHSPRRTSPAAALVLVAGCAAMPVPATPAPALYRVATTAAAGEWAQLSTPDARTLMRFSWRYREGRSTTQGSGSVRISVPDSLRLDFRGPLGSGRGAAAVVSSRTIWADPEDQVEKFVPNFQLLWGMLGTALAPVPGAEVLVVDDPQVVGGGSWRDRYGRLHRTRTGRPSLTDVRSGGRRWVEPSQPRRRRPAREGQARRARDEVRLDLSFSSITNPAPTPQALECPDRLQVWCPGVRARPADVPRVHGAGCPGDPDVAVLHSRTRRPIYIAQQ